MYNCKDKGGDKCILMKTNLVGKNWCTTICNDEEMQQGDGGVYSYRYGTPFKPLLENLF
jgi:hypothetical protein